MVGTLFTYILCLIGFSIILAYCVAITVYNKELPNAISQIVYSLDDKWKWTFSAVLVTVAFMIMPQLMEVAGDNYSFLSYLTCVGIIGVGIDPLDKKKKNITHYVSAIIMGISCQMLVYLISPWFLTLWIPYIIYTLYKEDGSKNMFIGQSVMILSTAALCLL